MSTENNRESHVTVFHPLFSSTSFLLHCNRNVDWWHLKIVLAIKKAFGETACYPTPLFLTFYTYACTRTNEHTHPSWALHIMDLPKWTTVHNSLSLDIYCICQIFYVPQDSLHIYWDGLAQSIKLIQFVTCSGKPIDLLQGCRGVSIDVVFTYGLLHCNFYYVAL